MSDTATSGRLETMPLDSIRPYWNNPRVIAEEDIDAVALSIQRYGYQSPIIVDTNGVVVIGHTRLAALRRLGWSEVEVLVTDLDPGLAQEYRVIDNRSAEYTTWDRAALIQELRAFTSHDVVEAMFPQLDLSAPEPVLDMSPPTERKSRGPVAPSREVTCPHCFHTFELPEKD